MEELSTTLACHHCHRGYTLTLSGETSSIGFVKGVKLKTEERFIGGIKIRTEEGGYLKSSDMCDILIDLQEANKLQTRNLPCRKIFQAVKDILNDKPGIWLLTPLERPPIARVHIPAIPSAPPLESLPTYEEATNPW
jgi:hypothetical protein